MERHICLNIHTEDLHNDKTWARVSALLSRLNKKGIKAVWFILPPHPVLFKQAFENESKWKQRVAVLKNGHQVIGQHSHFYGVQAKQYDMSLQNISTRIKEDRAWLHQEGIDVKGFLSGAWQINKQALAVLAQQGYQYDMSVNNIDTPKLAEAARKSGGILEIPATATIKKLFFDLIFFRARRRFLQMSKHGSSHSILLCALHFHDYDLNKFSNFCILKFLLWIMPLLGYQFKSIEEIVV